MRSRLPALFAVFVLLGFVKAVPSWDVPVYVIAPSQIATGTYANPEPTPCPQQATPQTATELGSILELCAPPDERSRELYDERVGGPWIDEPLPRRTGISVTPSISR